MSRPRACPDDTLLDIVLKKRQGWTHRKICAVFNATGVPTADGRPTWHPSYVTRMLDTRDGRRLAAATDPVAELASWPLIVRQPHDLAVPG